MAARQSLALFDGAMGGVNTMLNVINTKENMADRKYQRERRLVLDQQADEDRTRGIARQETADQRAGADFAYKQRINELTLSGLQGEERQRRMRQSYNLLLGATSFADGVEIDKPAVRNALNYFLSPVLNQGEPVNSRKQIGDIYPDPQNRGVYVELDVTPENGEPYRAPLTMGRSSRDDDPVALVPYEDLFNLVYEVTDDLQDAGFKGTQREILAQLAEFFRVASGDRSVEQAAAATAADDRKHRQRLELEDRKTGNQLQLEQEKARRGLGSGGTQNANIQLMTYLQENMKNPDGSPITVERAFELARMATSNPQALIMDTYKALLEDKQALQRDMTMMTGETLAAAQARLAAMTDEALLQQARDMVGQIRSDMFPSGGRQSLTLPPAGAGGSGSAQRLDLPQPAAEQAGGVVFESLPDAAQYPGVEFEDDETGITYRSNGKQWIEVQ